MKESLPRKHDIPDAELFVGAPPNDVQLYATEFAHDIPWPFHPDYDVDQVDPDAYQLIKLVEVLDEDGARDDDLFFEIHSAFPWGPGWTASSCYTEEEVRQCNVGFDIQRVHSHFRVKQVFLVDRPWGCPYKKPQKGWTVRVRLRSNCSKSVMETTATVAVVNESQTLYDLDLGNGMKITGVPVADIADQLFASERKAFGFSISAFCQRIVNAKNPRLAENLTPEWLMGFGRRAEAGELGELLFAEKRERIGMEMPHAKDDAIGFQTSCLQAGYHWVKVKFVRDLSKRGGPMPRCQDLPVGTYIVGMVPSGVQAYVASYCWSAHLHPAPCGGPSGKIGDLVATLDELAAKDEDVVFFDYMSLFQDGGEEAMVPKVYESANPSAKIEKRDGDLVQLPSRTPEQTTMFRFALFETTRLYAFAGGKLPGGQRVDGCRVVVLPRREDPQSFPDVGEIKRERNAFCEPPRVERKTRWGFVKDSTYAEGGWTCAEYAVARKNGTIVNAHHEDVRQVESARMWPNTLEEYARMMDEKADLPVSFAKKGDREAVRFNFYKYCYAFDQDHD